MPNKFEVVDNNKKSICYADNKDENSFDLSSSFTLNPEATVPKQIKKNYGVGFDSSKSKKMKLNSDQALITSYFGNSSASKSNLVKVEKIPDSKDVVDNVWSNITCKTKGRCPFYKKMPFTKFTVDAFSYGCIPSVTSYFLSHFHYDHYRGLDKDFHHPIYCSKVTANLVSLKLRVNKKYLNVLPLYKPCDVEGVQVILLNAHHCPGAVMFLFKMPKSCGGQMILHTGDFRANSKMELYPQLKLHVDKLYLDTTYCDPNYDFPPQETVLNVIVDFVRQRLLAHSSTLIVCGSYTIGKEKVFLSIAESLNLKIAAYSDKLKVLKCLENINLTNRLVSKWEEAQIHVLSMHQLKKNSLETHLRKRSSKFDKVIAIKPTGWVHDSNNAVKEEINLKVKEMGCVTLVELPYSEHSSYSEMKRFVQFLKPNKILPTVNVGNANSREKMEKYFSEWLAS